MFGSLDVLVVDDRPDTVVFLTEFLIQHCPRVDVASSAREAAAAVHRRRTMGEPYHLVISDLVMPDGDGLSLLRELRHRQDDVPFVFITGYRAMNPTFEAEAHRLKALAILDKPVDLRHVEDLLRQVAAIHSRKPKDDQPFFGTSRVIRRSESPGPRPTTSPASEALQRRPATDSYQVTVSDNRASPGSVPQPAPAVPPTGYQRRPSGFITPLGTASGTSRVRRSVTNPPTTASLSNDALVKQPETGFTARVRRGVSGTDTIRNPASQAGGGRDVHCGSCGELFKATDKPESYVTVCVHCGQLQRIDPAT